MSFSEVFLRTSAAAACSPRFISSCGGTRSGKTISILQYLYLLSSQDARATITSIVSETMPHLKRGAIRDFRTRVEWYSEDNWSRGTSTYTFPKTGAMIEFFSVDALSKVHGPARDRLFINEGQNISYDIARQLFVRTKGLIFIDYNPTAECWINTEIEPREDCKRIHSTYLDNKNYETGESFLSPAQVAEIEANKKDKTWWRVYGEGLVGQLEGLIYSFEQVDEMPSDGIECIGLDFGFSNDPTAIVRCKVDTGRKVITADELCYRSQMLNGDITKVLRPFSGIEVYADCAEPKSIAEIKMAGINIRPSDKGAPSKSDKLNYQIQWMQGWTLNVTKRSVNLIKELRNYTWAKDTSGRPLPHPIDFYNHALDALRYAVWTKFAKRPNEGSYSYHIMRL